MGRNVRFLCIGGGFEIKAYLWGFFWPHQREFASGRGGGGGGGSFPL